MNTARCDENGTTDKTTEQRDHPARMGTIMQRSQTPIARDSIRQAKSPGHTPASRLPDDRSPFIAHYFKLRRDARL
ncbi:hypothetical protein [Burkholderia pseudomallei]|uniref:hypothetical protein n=1 Tax=Burkholderia pseudomallei TaxID=28450 RepID=UPI0009B1D9DE|nr:hypothetical protein [Burkholderia pseudomallei]